MNITKMFLAVYEIYFLLRLFGRSMCFVRRRPAGGSREREKSLVPRGVGHDRGNGERKSSQVTSFQLHKVTQGHDNTARPVHTFTSNWT